MPLSPPTKWFCPFRKTVGARNIQPRDPKVRALPYPFLAALSISNDVEYCNLDFFEALMQFLNTKNLTPLGAGLGLEVTSSFFFYSGTPYTFSYFSGTDPKTQKSPAANRIEQYLQSGWIDTIHAYGDFDEIGGFRREHALRCHEVLSLLGLTMKVFTNHGGTENVQNVGKDASYHCGDLEEHYAYHVDLMKQHGVQYVWTDSMIAERLHSSSTKRKLFQTCNKHFMNKAQSLLGECILQDGSHFKGFLRFRSTGVNAPNLSSLAYQIGQIDWKTFYENRHVVVLYQHLGILYRNAGKCYQATVQGICRRPEVYLAPFYILERESNEGRLWVCGLSRLLTYVDMVESVEIEYDSAKNRYNILCDKVVKNPEILFQGLTFYSDPGKPVFAYHNGHQLPLLHNGPDDTGRYSVSVPMQKLNSIW